MGRLLESVLYWVLVVPVGMYLALLIVLIIANLLHIPKQEPVWVVEIALFLFYLFLYRIADKYKPK